MRQHYDNEAIGRLLARIKSESAALRKEDHELFEFCCYESLRDMGEIMSRACEAMRWGYTIEKTGDKVITGKCGEWEYTITGCCCADITIYNPKTDKQLDVQAYEDGYKLMDCDNETAAFADRTQTIRAIAYFMLTGRQTPSIRWQPDPDFLGTQLDQKGWC